MANQGYVDIGALQHKDGGGDAARTGYVDIGSLQHEDDAGEDPTLTVDDRMVTFPKQW